MKVFYLILIFCLIIYPSFGQYENSREVSITGRVKGFNPKDLSLFIEICRPGFFNKSSIRLKMDENGFFKTSFETFTPTEFTIHYNYAPIISASVYPNDSIYIETFANYEKNIEDSTGVVFIGNSAEFNYEIFQFKKLYYQQNINPYNKREFDKVKAIEKYTPIMYSKYLSDTVLVKCDSLLQYYIRKFQPSIKAIEWSKFYLELNEYYDELAWYPLEYHEYKKISEYRIEVPSVYYDPLLLPLPINESIFLCGDAFALYINACGNYVSKKIICINNNIFCNKFAPLSGNSADQIDSLLIYGIINYIEDPLFKQMMLANEFADGIYCTEKLQMFDKYEVSIINRYIIEPYLKNHLFHLYEKAKKVVKERKNEL
jgi:hypothetical protein